MYDVFCWILKNIEIKRNPIVCHRLEHELAFTGVAAIFGQPQMRTCYQRYQPMVTNGQWFGLAFGLAILVARLHMKIPQWVKLTMNFYEPLKTIEMRSMKDSHGQS